MSRASSETATSSCPCGSGRGYDACCGRYHAGAVAPDAEALMRSRYCAYVREDGHWYYLDGEFSDREGPS